MGAFLPLLAIAPLAAMLWANLPFDDDDTRKPLGIRSAVAGAVSGICCYGYYAVRLWLPVFYASAILVNIRTWWLLLKTRQGVRATGMLALAFALTFGPLVYGTLTHPLLQKRAAVTWVWNPADSLGVKIEKVLDRYPGHYGLDFLFRHGDPDIALSPPKNYGLFYWYMLPMMLLGLFALFSRMKTSRSARVLLVWVALYPVADLFNEHPSMHALRSLPGACALTLLAAVGITFFTRWLWRRHKLVTVAMSVAASIAIIVATCRFLAVFYGQYNLEPDKFSVGNVDLLKACEWLKPRLKDKDVVFVTGSGISHPDIFTLVALQYDPRQWFFDSKEIVKGPILGAFNHEYVCLRYGKMRFLFGGAVGEPPLQTIAELKRTKTTVHAVFIMRPGELPDTIPPSYGINDSEGEPSLLIYDMTI
jgi:hypothetical protein